MKTALVKTDICDDDAFFELHLDTKLLYMLLLLSPERGVGRIFKIGNRIQAFRTGLTEAQLRICQEQLSRLGLVYFFEGYVYLGEKSSFVEPLKGKLTPQLQEKEIKSIPPHIMKHFSEIAPERLRSGTGAAQEYVNVDVNVNDDVNINNTKNSKYIITARIFKELTAIFKQPKARPSTYSKAIGYALDDKFTEEDILKAARSLASSPFHQGQNDQKTVYANIAFLFRNSRAENTRRLAKWVDMPEQVKKQNYGF